MIIFLCIIIGFISGVIFGLLTLKYNMRVYIVKGFINLFWFRHHVSMDLKHGLYTLVVCNIGIQITY